MTERAFSVEDYGVRRRRLTGLLALVFIVAQVLFAAHAGAHPDPLFDHAAQTCEICLAGAVAGDPHDLISEYATPSAIFASVARPAGAAIVVANALLAASPRGPPVN